MRFDDRQWRKLDVPHDWSIEGSFAADNPSGKAGGYAPLGTGWYRRCIYLPKDAEGKRVWVEFEGVFAQADVWFNGHQVGHNGSGYLGFSCDLTPHAIFAGTNVLAVRAENLRPANRWYTGSGIYRHVWLEVRDPVHFGRWNSYVTTSNGPGDRATVRLKESIKNESEADARCDLYTRILDQAGAVVGLDRSETNIPAGAQIEIERTFRLDHPRLWSPEQPDLYRAVSELQNDGGILDRQETSFGILTIAFDADKGLLLNGRKVVLKGVCIHHDNGALGAAALDRAIERRLEILKGMGCNAIRLSHNPHAPKLLELCDRMDLLVYDEAFDKWSGFKPDGQGWGEDLRNFVARDRNHPSVILWSVGNEVKEQLKPEGAQLMKSMAKVVHELDPTRPVTCALHPGRLPGLELPDMASWMDVVSMNYQTQLYEADHKAHPDFVILGSETLPFFTYNERRTGQDNKFLPGNSWFAVKPFAAGQFIWAGIDYLGESTGWPSRGWPLGLVDTCGFRKAFSYYQQSLYDERPMVRIVVYDPSGKDAPGKQGWGWPQMASHWNWTGTKETLKVATFANCTAVELLLNGKSLGEKQLADFPDRLITWDVPNQLGTLRAAGRIDGKEVCVHELTSAGKPTQIVLNPDRGRILADGQDLSHLEVDLTDAEHLLVPDADRLVRFEVKGPATIVGVDNGDLSSAEAYLADRRTTKAGRCLVILQASRQAGKVLLTAAAPGLASATTKIEVVAPRANP
jgi:beta-galactosidase